MTREQKEAARAALMQAYLTGDDAGERHALATLRAWCNAKSR